MPNVHKPASKMIYCTHVTDAKLNARIANLTQVIAFNVSRMEGLRVSFLTALATMIVQMAFSKTMKQTNVIAQLMVSL